MSTNSLVLAGGVVLAACAAAALARTLPLRAPASLRDAPLQGLRGFSALFVFLHHALLWFRCTHGSGWTDPEWIRQSGECRVVLFFLLASTLFYGRLLDARGGSLDWLRLLVARTMRLAPVYLVAMALMLLVVAVVTTLRIDGAGAGIVLRSWGDIIGATAVWLGFSMLGMPAIDAYMNTPLITAGVTWTMPLELSFYLLLPLLALPLRVRMPGVALAIGLLALLWLAAWAPDPWLVAPFGGGMVVALAIRLPAVAAMLRHPACGAVFLAVLGVVTFAFPSAYAPLPLALQTLALAIVAAGNDLFGVLRRRGPMMLGNCAYSLYLLHGIVLYALFMLAIGAHRAATLSGLQFLGVVALATPVVIGLAWASQRWIEVPPKRAVPAMVEKLRQLLAPRQGRDAGASAGVGPGSPASAA